VFCCTLPKTVVKTNQTPPAVLEFDRYALHDAIASGGMATVHLGRMRTSAGVTRTVAIKRMHPHLLAEADFASMFLDEARLAMRIQHPNVVGTFDVSATDTELLLVMDFVLGESLDKLLRKARAERRSPPVGVICSVVAGVLAGLHAAHEARDEGGQPLDIVHRDVSPQNVIVGVDGVPRVVDFGVARAAGRLHTTEHGQIKGKLAYMAPEQLTMAKMDRRVDVFAAAAVLWEGLVGQRLFGGDNPGATVANVLDKEIVAPSAINPDVPAPIDAIVLRGLARHPDLRFSTAREMASALEQACPPATAREIGEWVQREAGEAVRARASLVADVESRSSAVHDRSAKSEGAPRAPEKTRLAHAGETITQSSVTATEGTPAAGRGSHRRVAALAIGVFSLLLASLLVARIAARHDAPRDPIPVASGSSVAPENAPATTASVTPTASAGVATEPLIIAPKPSGPSGPAPQGAGLGKTSSTHASTHVSAPHKPDCRNPFTLGAGGIRVPRPECF
jgi:eukaryotic-like serine/threonine-protein kinase